MLGLEGATRVISHVVSSIVVLGFGVIIKDGTNIRGLNTAATLWCSAAADTFALPACLKKPRPSPHSRWPATCYCDRW